MEKEKFSPCPFCGGEAILNPHFYDFLIACSSCGIGTHFYHTKEEAIIAWNTRTNTIPVGNGKDYTVVYE